jgi:hypothetical protein
MPQSGDVILRWTHDGYTLSTSGEAPQMAYKTYEEALAWADRFAQCQHVDVWQTGNDRAFTRVVKCRVVTEGTAP